jgi:hypothetical protein
MSEQIHKGDLVRDLHRGVWGRVLGMTHGCVFLAHPVTGESFPGRTARGDVVDAVEGFLRMGAADRAEAEALASEQREVIEAAAADPRVVEDYRRQIRRARQLGIDCWGLRGETPGADPDEDDDYEDYDGNYC